MPINQTSPIRIELPFLSSEGAVNVYLFREPEPVLIDAGFNSAIAWRALETALTAQFGNLNAAKEGLTRVLGLLDELTTPTPPP